VERLEDAELKMVTEIVTAMALSRGRPFDKRATGLTLCRAALTDEAFRAKLAEVHRRLEARHNTDLLAETTGGDAPLFRDLEREAEVVLGRER
jgi:hypothetical protein